MTTNSYEDIMTEVAATHGTNWNDTSKLALCYRFLEAGGVPGLDNWERFLVAQARAETHTRKPEGWVFVDDETEDEVGFALPGDYATAEDAMHDFRSEYANHFGVFFRDANGELHATDAESTAGDFQL